MYLVRGPWDAIYLLELSSCHPVQNALLLTKYVFCRNFYIKSTSITLTTQWQQFSHRTSNMGSCFVADVITWTSWYSCKFFGQWGATSATFVDKCIIYLYKYNISFFFQIFLVKSFSKKVQLTINQYWVRWWLGATDCRRERDMRCFVWVRNRI